MFRRKFLLLGVLAVLSLVVVSSAEDKVLYEKQSDFNYIIVSENEKGLRTLWFDDMGGAMQSVVKPGDPDEIVLGYAKVMPLGLTVIEEPKRVLIVGLGGGTLPMFLRKHYPKMQIDIVDIDPAVVEVAKKYFGFKEDDNMKAYVKDGRKFIEENKDPYDIIFLDAFGADNIPYDLATKEFLQGVRKAVGPKGIVIANIWDTAYNKLFDSMVRTYQDVFDDVYTVAVKHGSGNVIVLALPRKEELKKDFLVQQAKKIEKDKKYPMALNEFIADGYKHEIEKDPKGVVLLDKNKGKPAEQTKAEEKPKTQEQPKQQEKKKAA
jgi:spermidine synthase